VKLATVLVIGFEVPSQNRTERRHWSARSKERKRINWLIVAALPADGCPHRGRRGNSRSSPTAGACISDKANLDRRLQDAARRDRRRRRARRRQRRYACATYRQASSVRAATTARRP
jgi:hypothetical protein